MHRLNRIKTVLFATLLVLVLAIDLLLYLNGKHVTGANFLREPLLLALVTASLPLWFRTRFFSSKDVFAKLKGLYFGVAAIYGAYGLLFLLSKLVQSPLDKLPNRTESMLFGSFGNFVFGTSFTLLCASILVAILWILRDLVYFKRRKSSARNFNFLLAFLGLEVMFANFGETTFSRGVDWPPFRFVSEAVLYILIVLMVLNALRNSWVNYLNKRQKLHSLWIGAPLIAGVAVFQFEILQTPLIEEYSVSLAALIDKVGLFLGIYLAMSFLSLLLHLPTAGIFDRKIREIESLHDLSRTLSSVFDSTKIAPMITSKAAAIIRSDALWLTLVNPRSGALRVVSAESLAKADIEKLQLSSTNGVNGWIIENKSPLLINEAAKDERCKIFSQSEKKLGSLLGVPLIAKDRVMGILFSGKVDPFSYDEDEKELLQAFANQASVALENVRLFEELVIKERLEQELKIAHDAQRKLLPKVMPTVSGFEIDAICITANEVGGDYYDFFRLENERLAIAVGDVSGKGAKAAFYMAELKGMIESVARLYSSPKELVMHINKTLFGNLEPQFFISLIYATLDVKKKELVLARAGHCPLLYYSSRKKEASFVEPPGLGLGLEYGSKFDESLCEERIKLASGDVMVFYTDGVVEARDSQQREFDQDRLREFVSQHGNLTAIEIRAALIDEVRKFVGRAKTHDDLTCVVIKKT
jgi:serine phosphatase RsbU (regulator of sigma subunit)